jgi:hypothetical protein
VPRRTGGTHGWCQIHYRLWLEAGAPPIHETLEDTQPPLEERIREVRQRLARLQSSITKECPGEHRYVKHRDLLPPWCDACGYTDTGLHKSECGLGSKFDWHRDSDLHLDDLPSRVRDR